MINKSQVCVLLLALFSTWQQTNGQVLGVDCDEEDGSASICGEYGECIGQCRCLGGYFSPSGNYTDCIDKDMPDPRCSKYDRECVYCGSNFAGPCQKCTTPVIYDGQCIDLCPTGTSIEVSTLSSVDLVVRQCKGTLTDELPSWAIIVIAVVGGVLLLMVAVLIAAMACAFIRRSTIGQLDIADRNAESEKRKLRDDTVMENHATEETDGKGEVEQYFEAEDDDYEIADEDRDEFFDKFATLQAQANLFLKMLNDMRRRLKELPQNSEATQQYRNVMRDLTRLLYLLNKKPENIRIPPDGLQLLNWSEEILHRYLTAQRNDDTKKITRTNSPKRVSVIGDETGVSNDIEVGKNPKNSRQRSYRMSSIGDQDETDF